jgi:hypothetical protein
MRFLTNIDNSPTLAKAVEVANFVTSKNIVLKNRPGTKEEIYPCYWSDNPIRQTTMSSLFTPDNSCLGKWWDVFNKFNTPVKDVNTFRVTVYKDRTEWRNEKGDLHREGGLPAVEFNDGHKKWYCNGLLHRENGPAVELSYGTKFWYKYDKLHREDGPAVGYKDGESIYCLNSVAYCYKEDWEKEVAKLKEPKIPEEVLKAWKILEDNGYSIKKG